MTILARTMRTRWASSSLLIATLFAFLLAFYFYPIVSFLLRSASTSEITDTIPATATALAQWDGEGLPGEPVYAALVSDLNASAHAAAILGRRLNALEPGMRTVERKAAADRARPDFGHARRGEGEAGRSGRKKMGRSGDLEASEARDWGGDLHLPARCDRCAAKSRHARAQVRQRRSVPANLPAHLDDLVYRYADLHRYRLPRCVGHRHGDPAHSRLADAFGAGAVLAVHLGAHRCSWSSTASA
ncbi:hypothetical protein [Aminobacter carboxidus]|uniref:Uncharacterized protein n=1 Tax=Aminobacter carboxidus TaxID=376165 RepID=A0ABR9GP53_9HYPH|nr:hypothetical protein [Aminobacter carboxidus]MBE1205436.1 hypothetical protein [Aminobacter carboxidus]